MNETPPEKKRESRIARRGRGRDGYLNVLDPGKHRCGLAVFDRATRRLVAAAEPHRTNDAAGAVREFVEPYLGPASLWVAEEPQDYPGQGAKADDLESLRFVIRALGIDTTIRPGLWKGNVPKTVHHRRILSLLDEGERAILEALPRTRDAMDAVGLGLFMLRRCGRGGRRPPSGTLPRRAP